MPLPRSLPLLWLLFMSCKGRRSQRNSVIGSTLRPGANLLSPPPNLRKEVPQQWHRLCWCYPHLRIGKQQVYLRPYSGRFLKMQQVWIAGWSDQSATFSIAGLTMTILEPLERTTPWLRTSLEEVELHFAISNKSLSTQNGLFHPYLPTYTCRKSIKCKENNECSFIYQLSNQAKDDPLKIRSCLSDSFVKFLRYLWCKFHHHPSPWGSGWTFYGRPCATQKLCLQCQCTNCVCARNVNKNLISYTEGREHFFQRFRHFSCEEVWHAVLFLSLFPHCSVKYKILHVL